MNIQHCIVCNVIYSPPKKCVRTCLRHRTYTYNKKYDFFHARPNTKISNLQSTIYGAIKKAFGKKTYQEVLFPWCYNSPGYRYDIVVPELNLIVECDGQQHFEYVKFFMKNKANYEKYRAAEQTKMQLAKDKGWSFVRISYIEDTSVEHIKAKIMYCLNKEVKNG